VTWRDIVNPAEWKGVNGPEISEVSACQCFKASGFAAHLGPMTCAAYYESGWNCGATDVDSDGSEDFGLAQINSYYWCSGGPKSTYDECHDTCQDMLNCQPNCNCALVVFNQDGMSAWYGYNSHVSTCEYYAVPAGC